MCPENAMVRDKLPTKHPPTPPPKPSVLLYTHMIAYLSGTVLEKGLDYIIINTNGVGYYVAVTNNIIEKVEVDKEISIHTYFAVRENAQDLYGFENKQEKEMFELLLTISGIGPKSAMSIMSSASVETLIEGISSGDAAYLAKMSGIGKKSAEKIVVNLKDKLGDLSAVVGENSAPDSQTQNQSTMSIDALVALGYSERESRDAIREAIKGLESSKDGDSTPAAEAIIKEALKNLSN